MSARRWFSGVAGALFGIAVPTAQFAYSVLYASLRTPILSGPSQNFVGVVLTLLVVFALLFCWIWGSIAGTLARGLVNGSTAIVIRAQGASICLLIVYGLISIPVLLEPFASASRPSEDVLVIAYLLFFNAPLQAAVALAVLSKIVLNRLREEEKRAQYDARAAVE